MPTEPKTSQAKSAAPKQVVSVSYSIDDGVEQFSIRSKGKSRRVIMLDRDQAKAVHHQIGRYLAFGEKQAEQPAFSRE